jgi:hypothetical protein
MMDLAAWAIAITITVVLFLGVEDKAETFLRRRR